ncbi:unnamed protein product, partial [Cyprideis torosa]
MLIHFERSRFCNSDCRISTVSWMGRINDVFTEDGDLLLNPNDYYFEGWLATGNSRGIVGITYTATMPKKLDEMPPRTNFNLRGHHNAEFRRGFGVEAQGMMNRAPNDQLNARDSESEKGKCCEESPALVVVPRVCVDFAQLILAGGKGRGSKGHGKLEVTLVSWNEPYQKLATCDSTGIIFVWIRYEDRWSIELINDRNTAVLHFQWSHDGKLALICYDDSCVLVGSVAGQRFWSRQVQEDPNNDADPPVRNPLRQSGGAWITCGTWDPTDTKAILGSRTGSLVALGVGGARFRDVSLRPGDRITAVSYNCPKYNLEEMPDNLEPYTLCVAFVSGYLMFLTQWDDPASAITVDSGLYDFKSEWSYFGKYIAVAGERRIRLQPTDKKKVIRFFTHEGNLVYQKDFPEEAQAKESPVLSMTWGHCDRRIFVSVGNRVVVAQIYIHGGSLLLLCALRIFKLLGSSSARKRDALDALPLPRIAKGLVRYLGTHTLQGLVPDPRSLRDFVCRPPKPHRLRYHCTMIRFPGGGDETFGLFLEYLGGLLPLLKGKRVSKLRPDFLIMDPQGCPSSASLVSLGILPDGSTPQPKGREGVFGLFDTSTDSRGLGNLAASIEGSTPLVLVTSNLWGTKFKFTSLSPHLPPSLGRVIYKTSLLHLQPRKMTLFVTELKGDKMHSTSNLPLSYSRLFFVRPSPATPLAPPAQVPAPQSSEGSRDSLGHSETSYVTAAVHHSQPLESEEEEEGEGVTHSPVTPSSAVAWTEVRSQDAPPTSTNPPVHVRSATMATFLNVADSSSNFVPSRPLDNAAPSAPSGAGGENEGGGDIRPLVLPNKRLFLRGGISDTSPNGSSQRTARLHPSRKSRSLEGPSTSLQTSAVSPNHGEGTTPVTPPPSKMAAPFLPRLPEEERSSPMAMGVEAIIPEESPLLPSAAGESPSSLSSFSSSPPPSPSYCGAGPSIIRLPRSLPSTPRVRRRLWEMLQASPL